MNESAARLPDRARTAAARVAAVVVTYWPQAEELTSLLLSLRDQVDRVIICDNSDGASIDTVLPPVLRAPEWEGFLYWHSLGSNLGIGAALNQGFEIAARLGYEAVLTLDQDSEATPGMVVALWEALRTHRNAVAAAPQPWDARIGVALPLIIRENAKMRRTILQSNQCVMLDHAITSGMLVCLAAWRRIGPFREDFFIDYIDIEWCWRVQLLGDAILGVGQAQLLHRMGASATRLPGNRWFFKHGPARHVTHFRNAVRLHRLHRRPWRWHLWHAAVLLRRAVGISLLFSPRWQRFRAIMLGVWVGWKGAWR